ncbi:scavenger receptor cysteine-rich domain-containing group B protein-like isoform X5 [Zonotrichia albicollis]|uniref:scavenger receptor cysteine-rich domain-containing group B protein-like isoform X5 n=1 Tax=Zonotrichia albicollis TaxID=44394 RepID=UPI003D80B1EE
MRIGGPPHLGAHLGLLLHLWGLCGVPPGTAMTPSGATPEPSGVPPGTAMTPSGATLKPSGVPPGRAPVPPVPPEPSGEHLTPPGGPVEGQVRLAGGPHRCAGRVEVFHAGRWGSVCDDTWDLAAARVTCRQVRCGPALWAPGAAQFGQGAGPIWLDGLRCAGTEEHLAQCPGHTWGRHRCNHAEDAGAACAVSAVPAPPQVRLSGAPDRCAGRVEVLRAHLWGTVCDDAWGLRQARVLCAHLGCGPALEAPGAARYGRGVGPIWLDDVTCTGEEPDFFRCAHRAWGEHNCHHGEDAGVICAGNSSSGAVRLVAGPHLCAGRVEVLHEGHWGSVCDRGWDLSDAQVCYLSPRCVTCPQVVCHQLGCGRALSAPGGARFGRGSGQVWLSDLTCAGSERHLGQCPAPPWGRNTCGHERDAAVECAAPPPSPAPSPPAQVRLAGGPHRCAGRVEVRYLGRWGSVCGRTWDLAAARVTCRQVRCGPALAAPGRGAFGTGEGPVWLGRVRCTGEELTLDRCDHAGWGESGCGHEENAAAVCAGADPPQVRLRGGAGPCSGQVQVLLNRTWLQVCGLTWGLPEAQVLCRQLGCGPALSAPAGPHLDEQRPHLAGQEPHLAQPHLAEPHLSEPHLSEQPHLAQGQLYLSGLTCDGSEAHLAECLQEGAGPGTCAGGAAAELRCEMPKGAAPSCSYLVALLVLMTSLGGALLWLTLRARCVPAHLDAPRAPGAIYLPRRSSPGQGEELQLMDDAP